MRIATWNLERLSRGLNRCSIYDEELQSLRANVTVVTEPGPGFVDRYPSSCMSPQRRAQDEAWVAIVGDSLVPIDLDIPYERLAASCRFEVEGTSATVYGSILPWLSAQSHAPDVYGKRMLSFIELFERALYEQVVDMNTLRSMCPSDCLIWTGDFNHTLVGRPISTRASDMLKSAIADLGLKAVNADAPHREQGLHALDLICIEQSWTTLSVENHSPMFNNLPLSDHRWYVAEVQP
jgi:hypothetical protein